MFLPKIAYMHCYPLPPRFSVMRRQRDVAPFRQSRKLQNIRQRSHESIS